MDNNYCDGRSRRDLLRLGLGTAAGLGLAQSLRMTAASEPMTAVGRDAKGPQAASLLEAPGKVANAPAKRCIFLWMDGGPSHHETFDPKPEAPSEIRGEFDAIATNVPGQRIGELLPRIAQVMNRVTVVRSVAHHDPGHGGGNHYLTTGSPTPVPIGCGDSASFHPSIGSFVARELGTTVGLPAYVQFALPSPLRSGGPNFLGSAYAPFLVANNPNNADFTLPDVTLPAGVGEGRARSRMELRRSMDRLQRMADEAAADPARGFDRFQERAVGLVTSPRVKEAFDLTRESATIRDAYGRTMVGQQCLLARRLVEAGVPFVTVQHAGWDHHTNIFTYLKTRWLPIFDQAFSQLILDLNARGLLEDTLVVALGEFGRTPKINKDGGRDHWPGAMSIVWAGACVPRGQIVGATDSHGAAPSERPLRVEDFACSLYAKLGLNPHKEFITPEGRPVRMVNGGKPIPELFG
ncbi:MAG: DUF1501 domain-containing protein [Pirellulales bacterium]